ncbi:hypothetical protein [Ralstonia pseudosolanacearum]|uniref:hypothetical protein n=1 Tax=Ralstonia pseudosolanacearum TaxID=1310165 RepID=UPI0039C74496
MTKEKLVVIEQASKIPNSRITDRGAEVIGRIYGVLGRLYEGTGIELSIGWLNDFHLRACAYEPETGNHKIEISYGLVIWLYHQAHIFTAIAETEYFKKEYGWAFSGIHSGSANLLPLGTTAAQCCDLMFDTVLEWVFMHELAHHAQSHLKIRSAHSSTSSVEIVDEAYVVGAPLPIGREAAISHATEIAADHEAIVHLLPYRAYGNKDGLLPKTEVFMLVCGLVCLFNKFNGSSTNFPSPVPVGSHPHPAVRFSLARSAIMGVLSHPDFITRNAPWALDNENTFLMIGDAYTLGAIIGFELDGRSAAESMAFVQSTNIENRPDTKAYLGTMFSTLQELKPEIEREYIFPLAPKLPIITKDWENLIGTDSDWAPNSIV